jgi:hypothetical protein
MGGGRRQFRINGRGSMLAYIWEDGRFLGFDLVEWLAWLGAVSILALFTLVVRFQQMIPVKMPDFFGFEPLTADASD